MKEVLSFGVCRFTESVDVFFGVCVDEGVSSLLSGSNALFIAILKSQRKNRLVNMLLRKTSIKELKAIISKQNNNSKKKRLILG